MITSLSPEAMTFTCPSSSNVTSSPPSGPTRSPVTRLEVASAEENLDRSAGRGRFTICHHVRPRSCVGKGGPAPPAGFDERVHPTIF